MQADLSVAGNSQVWETGYSGVWWIRHLGAGDKIAAEEIAVTNVPEILVSHSADIAAAASRIRRDLAEEPPDRRGRVTSMPEHETIGEVLSRRGVSRRALLKYTTYLASIMALPPMASKVMAEALASARRQSVIWLSFQECTGCTESLTRSFGPTIEDIIFDLISLDYHETLQAVSGAAAEEARLTAMKENEGKYLVVVDGSVSAKDGGVYSTNAGKSNLETLKETAEHAMALISVGTCAAFGGIPHAKPNPTGAVPVTDIIKDKPVINISGCPPIAEVIAGTIAYLISFGKIPELDHLNRPKAFFGDSIHDRSTRRPFYDRGLFAKSFDDEGAQKAGASMKSAARAPSHTMPAQR